MSDGDTEYESAVDQPDVVEVEGEEVLCCPGCNRRPHREAVYAGAESHCDNEDCPVSLWRWDHV